MPKLTSIRKKYRQKKLKAKKSQKAYVKSLSKLLDKVTRKPKDNDT